jgi:hypothetical protein
MQQIVRMNPKDASLAADWPMQGRSAITARKIEMSCDAGQSDMNHKKCKK